MPKDNNENAATTFVVNDAPVETFTNPTKFKLWRERPDELSKEPQQFDHIHFDFDSAFDAVSAYVSYALNKEMGDAEQWYGNKVKIFAQMENIKEAQPILEFIVESSSPENFTIEAVKLP